MNISDVVSGIDVSTRLLVASDFDGTLAPLINDPNLSRPDPRAEEALRRLADVPGVTVAIVSGRRRRQLIGFFEPGSPFIFIGEHGNDIGAPSAGAHTAAAAITARLREASKQLPGSWVEEKVFSSAIHYRMSEPGAATQVIEELAGWASGIPGASVMEGKMILEIAMAARDKGDSVIELKEACGADRIIFLGDDVTDEAVFARLGPDDIGVKVGPGGTAATWVVDDVADVVDLLNAILDRKSGPADG